MEIRPLPAHDIELAAQLDQAVNATPWSLANYQQSWDDPNHYLLGLYQAEQLLSLCVYSLVCDQAEILQLWTRQGYQKHGYAKKLLGQIISNLRQSGVTQLFLEVMINNQAAQALYQGLGFNTIHTRRGYYRQAHGMVDALVMAYQYHD